MSGFSTFHFRLARIGSQFVIFKQLKFFAEYFIKINKTAPKNHYHPQIATNQSRNNVTVFPPQSWVSAQKTQNPIRKKGRTETCFLQNIPKRFSEIRQDSEKHHQQKNYWKKPKDSLDSFEQRILEKAKQELESLKKQADAIQEKIDKNRKKLQESKSPQDRIKYLKGMKNDLIQKREKHLKIIEKFKKILKITRKKIQELATRVAQQRQELAERQSENCFKMVSTKKLQNTIEDLDYQIKEKSIQIGTLAQQIKSQQEEVNFIEEMIRDVQSGMQFWKKQLKKKYFFLQIPNQ